MTAPVRGLAGRLGLDERAQLFGRARAKEDPSGQQYPHPLGEANATIIGIVILASVSCAGLKTLQGLRRAVRIRARREPRSGSKRTVLRGQAHRLGPTRGRRCSRAAAKKGQQDLFASTRRRTEGLGRIGEPGAARRRPAGRRLRAETLTERTDPLLQLQPPRWNWQFRCLRGKAQIHEPNVGPAGEPGTAHNAEAYEAFPTPSAEGNTLYFNRSTTFDSPDSDIGRQSAGIDTNLRKRRSD
jgi:hypothetical protein